MLVCLAVVFELRRIVLYYLFPQFSSYFILDLGILSKVVGLLRSLKENTRRNWHWFRLTLEEIWSLKHVRIGYFLFIWFFLQASVCNIIMLDFLIVIFTLRQLDFYYTFLQFSFYFILNLSTICKVVNLLRSMREKVRKSWE